MKGMIKGKISSSGSPIVETRVIGTRTEIVIEGIAVILFGCCA